MMMKLRRQSRSIENQLSRNTPDGPEYIKDESVSHRHDRMPVICVEIDVVFPPAKALTGESSSDSFTNWFGIRQKFVLAGFFFARALEFVFVSWSVNWLRDDQEKN